MPYEEEEAVKDAVIKKSIKEAGSEVERTEGRGLVKVGGDMAEQSLTRVTDCAMNFRLKYPVLIQ